jgi:thioredoxin reductase (NADPH)
MRGDEPAARAAIVGLLEIDPGRVAQELRRRYGADYQVVCTTAAVDANNALVAARESGQAVAVTMTDRLGGGPEGAAFLERTRELHPLAKRVLLIDWGGWRDPRVADGVREAMASGLIDYYAIRPAATPDEDFHRLIAELLQEWARAQAPAASEATLIGSEGTPRVHELRTLLAGSGVPFQFAEHRSPEACRLLGHDERTAAGGDTPVLVVRGGQVLRDPSDAEVARGFGVDTELPPTSDFDVVIVGAGPSGLTAAVYASSEGLTTLLIDRHGIGGQAATSSLIRNYLGFSRGITGGELAQRAYQQAWVFGASFALMREVQALRGDERRWIVELDRNDTARASTVVIAAGVAYRRLGVPTLDRLIGSGVYYGASVSEARLQTGGSSFVVGAGNSAGQAALHLSRFAHDVTLVVRGHTLADSMSNYLRETLAATENILIRLHTEVVDGAGASRLEELTLRDRGTREVERLPASSLFIMIGAEPRTDWLPDAVERDAHGYLLTGVDLVRDGTLPPAWPLQRAPFNLETSAPGVFAVGDVRHGSTKRVASGVGEGSVVIAEIHRLLQAT